MKRSKTTHKLAAAVMSGAILGVSGQAFAGNGTNTNLSDLTGNIVTGSAGIPNLITMMSYIFGTALAVSGLFKVKQHVDNPGQTPLKDGTIRLAIGGGLLALPFIMDTMSGTIANGNTNGFDTTTLQIDDTATFAP